MANPTLLEMPIARDGNKNTIPTTDNGTTGLLSQQYGWQLINAIPPQQGGKAVKREDFNGALYLLSNLLFYLQKGWQFEWASNQTYYAGCVVKDTSDGKMYMCLNNVTSTTAPHSDSTNWKLWDLSMLADYLPLSGGTMTGFIYRSRSYPYYMRIYGGPKGEKCGNIQIMGAEFDDTDKNSGRIVLEALSDIDDDVTTLFVKRNGSVTLTTPAYPYGTDIAGPAIVAKSLGRNSYIKRASGEIIQTVWIQLPINATSATCTFPISFSSISSYTAVATVTGTTPIALGVSYDDNTNVTIYAPAANYLRIVAVVAIGS